MRKEFKSRTVGSKYGKKIKPGLAAGPDREDMALVANCFASLAEYSRDLSQTIARYVLTGEPVSVLDTLEGIEQNLLQQTFVQAPRRYHTYSMNQADNNRYKQAVGYFDDFYCASLLNDHDICRRWGLVRATTVDTDPSLLNYDAQLPQWFNALMIDLSSTLDDSSHYTGREDKEKKWAAISYLNISWLTALLQQYDFGPAIWLQVLLHRTGWSSTTHNTMGYLLTTVDLPKWLSQLNTLTLLEQINLSGKNRLAKELEKYSALDEVLPTVMQLATDSSKTIRKQCPVLLDKLSQQPLLDFMQSHFADFNATGRKELAALIASYGGDNASDCLQQLADNEKSKSVTEAINSALGNKKAAQTPTVTQPMTVPDYQPATTAAPIGADWLERLETRLATLIDNARQRAEQEIINNRTTQAQDRWAQNNYESIKSVDRNLLRAALNNIATGKGKTVNYLVMNIIVASLVKDPEFGLSHIVNFLKIHARNFSLFDDAFEQWLSSHPGQFTDLRQLDGLLKLRGMSSHCIANWILHFRWDRGYELPKIPGLTVWPFFVENDHYLNEAFSLPGSKTQGHSGYNLGYAMLVVGQFPRIPEKYLLSLYQHALSTSKTYGPLARKVLTGYGVVGDRVASALTSSKQDERVIAANWLADIKFDGAVKPLQQTLKKEKKELPKAAMLNALHQLGENIDNYLGSSALLKEAQTGLKKALPKSIAWLPFDSLPTVHWNDGKNVDPQIIQWWVVLACKLKQPEGNPLLDLYMAQLQQKDRTTLGSYILQLFISHDTLCPNHEQAAEYAKANQQATFDMWQGWAQSSWGKEYINRTLQDAYRYCYERRRSEYLGSAISAKGLLALAGQANGTEAVEIVSRYMKDHYKRHHQVTALISALGCSDDPVVIQLVLSVARRHRTNSVQEKAKELVEIIATRNGWSQDELADRTIPTAGLEANGTMVMSYGTRQLTVKLDDNMKVVLANEGGKTIKSLPAARQDDDAEQVSQAKKDFSACKKTLKQVVDLQGKRLYEAMCLERQWDFADWQQYLLEHPIMSRLVQRLVWQVEDGYDRYWVRPTPELELIDVEDDDHTPSDTAKISVAHSSQLSTDDVKEWLANFKSEKIKPLFDQFAQPNHQLTDADKNAKQLNYHLGWVTDTFTLRGILTKRGYQRGHAQDAGSFTHYYKDFASLGLRTRVEFSGSYVPEDNLSAVLYHIGFVDPDDRGWMREDKYLSLSDVPDVLLSEAMLDYEAVANKAAFDENWKNKTLW